MGKKKKICNPGNGNPIVEGEGDDRYSEGILRRHSYYIWVSGCFIIDTLVSS